MRCTRPRSKAVVYLHDDHGAYLGGTYREHSNWFGQAARRVGASFDEAGTRSWRYIDRPCTHVILEVSVGKFPTTDLIAAAAMGDARVLVLHRLGRHPCKGNAERSPECTCVSYVGLRDLACLVAQFLQTTPL